MFGMNMMGGSTGGTSSLGNLLAAVASIGLIGFLVYAAIQGGKNKETAPPQTKKPTKAPKTSKPPQTPKPADGGKKKKDKFAVYGDSTYSASEANAFGLIL